MLDAAFEMAYSEERGYLSPDPYQCGSGASISVTLFLPSLSVSSAFERLRAECARHGFEIVPLSLHGGNPGDLYRITCKLPRSANEKQTATNFEAFCDRIVQNESRLLHSACDQMLDRIIDHGRRAYGLLTYASEISEPELLSLLSRLRLGLILAPDAIALPHVSFTTLNSLLAEGLNGSVIASSPAPCTSESDCRKKRAKLTSKLLCPAENRQ
jgi:protein arginine kinase